MFFNPQNIDLTNCMISFRKLSLMDYRFETVPTIISDVEIKSSVIFFINQNILDLFIICPFIKISEEFFQKILFFNLIIEFFIKIFF